MKLTEGSWPSVVPCVAWKEWNSMGRVDLVWIEVEIVVSTPENKNYGGGEHSLFATLLKPWEKFGYGTFPPCCCTCHACLDVRCSSGLAFA